MPESQNQQSQTPGSQTDQTQTPAPGTTTTQTPPTDGSWVPYKPDPTVDANTNLARKADYDAKVPAGHDPNVARAAPGTQEQKPPAQQQQEQKPPAQEQQAGQLQFTDLVAPEGFKLDEGLGTEFIQVINANAGDPKALANALLSLNVKAQQKASEMASQGWDDTKQTWKKETEADPVVGGAKYQQSLDTARDIAKRFGGDTFAQALELTGMGDHPEWVRFTAKIAPFLKEAGPLPGNPAPAVPEKRYSSTNLYPDQK